MAVYVGEDLGVLEVQDRLGTYVRTDGLGRLLHPEIAVSGVQREEARPLLRAIVQRIESGNYLELAGGCVSVGDGWFQYEWKPEQFLFWFERGSRPCE